MTTKEQLIQLLNSLVVHPIIEEVLAEEIGKGNIKTESQLREEIKKLKEEL